MLTDADLKAIRERVDAATPGPWAYEVSGGSDRFIRSDGVVIYGWLDDGGAASAPLLDVGRGGYDLPEHGVNLDANAAFIASSRTEVVRLLDDVERLRKENAEMKAMIYAATVEAINAAGAETAMLVGGRGISPDDLTPIPSR